VGPVIASSQDAYEELRLWFPEDTISLQERFVALYLNRANRLLGAYLASFGGITGTVADPRLIISVALKTAAVGIIIAHNHPSGNLKPSRADEELTSRIRDVAHLLDIKLLDHIILCNDGFYSFADSGII
jgi:DNA repair protein RadC